jgi:hypothetical protein
MRVGTIHAECGDIPGTPGATQPGRRAPGEPGSDGLRRRQGEAVRITGKKRDGLQACMQTIRAAGLGVPLQFQRASGVRRARYRPSGSGEGFPVVVPSPSWPLPLSPEVQIVPSRFTATVCSPGGHRREAGLPAVRPILADLAP